MSERGSSPATPSPLSDSEYDSQSYSGPTNGPLPSISLPNSPGSSHPGEEPPLVEDSVTCLWDDCGGVYTHLPTLIAHIHNGEVCHHDESRAVSWCPGLLTIILANLRVRSHRSPQIELLLRMGILYAAGISADLPVRPHFTYSVAHWGETFHLQFTR